MLSPAEPDTTPGNVLSLATRWWRNARGRGSILSFLIDLDGSSSFSRNAAWLFSHSAAGGRRFGGGGVRPIFGPSNSNAASLFRSPRAES